MSGSIDSIHVHRFRHLLVGPCKSVGSKGAQQQIHNNSKSQTNIQLFHGWHVSCIYRKAAYNQSTSDALKWIFRWHVVDVCGWILISKLVSTCRWRGVRSGKARGYARWRDNPGSTQCKVMRWDGLRSRLVWSYYLLADSPVYSTYDSDWPSDAVLYVRPFVSLSMLLLCAAGSLQ